MIRVGVIGVGKFGSKIVSVLNKIEEVEILWSGGTNLSWWEQDNVDWVFIASPHEMHYEQAKHFLTNGVNVFLEKPAAFSLDALNELFGIADKTFSTLYVDDLYLFKDPNFFNKIECGHQSLNRDSNFIDLIAYHHMYLLKYQDEFLKSESLKIDIILNQETIKQFRIISSDGLIYNFSYLLNPNKNYDSLEYNFGGDALNLLIRSVLNGTCDLNKNRSGARFATDISWRLKEMFFGKALVVGGGVYGSTAALALARAGFHVDLFEQNDQLISTASFVNQYRLHLGFHYPRSKLTRDECITSFKEFTSQYPQCVNNEANHFYAVAKSKSLLNKDEYLSVMKESGLEFKEVSPINKTTVTILTKESQIDPIKLRQVVSERLFSSGVMVKTNKKFEDVNYLENSNHYSVRVFATYSKINDFRVIKKQLKLQIVEKIVVSLPENLKKLSLVVMDGPFFSIDPIPGTNFHVIGAVTEANHSVQIGDRLRLEDYFDGLDTGKLCKNPNKTNKDKIINLVESFLGKGILHYVGSYFVTKATNIYVEDTADRRHEVEADFNLKNIYVFGGKISAATLSAKKVSSLATEILNLNLYHKNVIIK
jgi:hypothetical protein